MATELHLVVGNKASSMSAWTIAQLRVMIIDDLPAARSMLRKMLKDMEVVQVIESANGREGLKLLDAAPEMVDLVICDWNMPDLSGIMQEPGFAEM